MDRKLSDIDLSYFIGQTVEEVNTEKNVSFGMTFESGFLMIECPWRIKNSKEVMIGYSDILFQTGNLHMKMLRKYY